MTSPSSNNFNSASVPVTEGHCYGTRSRTKTLQPKEEKTNTVYQEQAASPRASTASTSTFCSSPSIKQETAAPTTQPINGTYRMELDPHSVKTGHDLKMLICKINGLDYKKVRLKVVYDQKEIKDDQMIDALEIMQSSTLHVVLTSQ